MLRIFFDADLSPQTLCEDSPREHLADTADPQTKILGFGGVRPEQSSSILHGAGFPLDKGSPHIARLGAPSGAGRSARALAQKPASGSRPP